MLSEIIHTLATKIALISFAFVSIFNNQVPFPNETKYITIKIETPSNYTETTVRDNQKQENTIFPQINLPSYSDLEKVFPTLPKEKPVIKSSDLPIQKFSEPVENIPVADDSKAIEKISVEPESLIKKNTPESVSTTKDSNSKTFDVISKETRDATVNILCTTNITNLGSATGSGIIIDPKGIILTNAHVAQLFLLNGAKPGLKSNCTIRSGDPAEETYNAELLHISPTWVMNHPDTLIQMEPRGTGENDFALLRITGSLNKNEELPKTFPYAPIDVTYIPKKNDVLILSGYPASLLDSISITKNLRLQTVAGYVTEIFTFSKNTIDLFQIQDSVVAQKGSSGGAVVTHENKVGGIIVTSVKTKAGNQTSVGLRAITIGHINRSIINQTGFSLQSMLSGDIRSKASAFQKNTAPALSALLAETIFK